VMIVSWLFFKTPVAVACHPKLMIEDITHVDCAALTVQRPDDIGGADGLALAHFDDGANVAENVLEKELQVEAGLLVNGGTDTLDAAAAREAGDRGLSDTLDVVAEDLSKEWWRC
jgi:hypothetical protein